jgi:hypothetical protein
MSRWKKNQKEFSVSLFYDDRRGSMAVIPKPVLEKLGIPSNIKFEINKNGKITIDTGDNKK